MTHQIPPKQTLYRTCFHKESGQYAQILTTMPDKDGTWKYTIRTTDNELHGLVHESELCNFCL